MLRSFQPGGGGIIDRIQQFFIGTADPDEQFEDEEEGDAIAEDYTEEGLKRYQRAGKTYLEEPPVLYPDEDTGRYEYKKIEPGLYWIRHSDTNRRFMIVAETHPLIAFCHSLAQHERSITDSISPESGDVPLPGIIGYFVERVAPPPSPGHTKSVDGYDGRPLQTDRYSAALPNPLQPQPQKMANGTTSVTSTVIDVKADMPIFELPKDDLLGKIQDSSDYTQANDLTQQEHLKLLPTDMCIELQVADDLFLRSTEMRWYTISANHYSMYRAYIQRSISTNSTLIELSKLNDNVRLDSVTGRQQVIAAMQKAHRSSLLIERMRQAAVQAATRPSVENIALLRQACDELNHDLLN